MFKTVVVALAMLVVTGMSPSARAEARNESQPPWLESSGEGFALGAENGLWAGKLTTGLRARIPFSQHFALTLRPMVLHGFDEVPVRTDFQGRVELQGGSAVYFNVLRVYGAAGIQAGMELSGSKHSVIGGIGGHAGLEAFLRPSLSFFFEIGTTGTTDRFTSGGTAMSGILFYL